VARAGFSRPHSEAGDPGAQLRLCAGMPRREIGGQTASLAARTRFFDERVLAAISAGTRQVVILGAGYDDRALRFRTAGVRFIEVDHPVTQADKARRLNTMNAADGPVLAAADFSQDDVASALAACGHAAGQATLFLCEGLLVYLDAPTCVRLLAGLRARAAAGSILAASLAVHRDGLDSALVVEVANARRRTGSVPDPPAVPVRGGDPPGPPAVPVRGGDPPDPPAEPWVTILPAAAHLALVGRAGWEVAGSVDAAQLGTGAEPGRSLLITARPAAGGDPAADDG
jgi:methyltransferase (TIGR00027 family)